MCKLDLNKAQGEALVALRIERGVTPEALAAACGLSRSGWSRIESGSTKLTITRLREIARPLGMQPWEVMKFIEERTAPVGAKPEEE